MLNVITNIVVIQISNENVFILIISWPLTSIILLIVKWLKCLCTVHLKSCMYYVYSQRDGKTQAEIADVLQAEHFPVSPGQSCPDWSTLWLRCMELQKCFQYQRTTICMKQFHATVSSSRLRQKMTFDQTDDAVKPVSTLIKCHNQVQPTLKMMAVNKS